MRENPKTQNTFRDPSRHRRIIIVQKQIATQYATQHATRYLIYEIIVIISHKIDLTLNPTACFCFITQDRKNKMCCRFVTLSFI